jgi:hypothetical protein
LPRRRRATGSKSPENQRFFFGERHEQTSFAIGCRERGLVGGRALDDVG